MAFAFQHTAFNFVAFEAAFFAGTASATEARDALAATALEAFTGTLTRNESADGILASGAELIVGNAPVNELSDITGWSGAEAFFGAGAASETVDLFSASAVNEFTGIIEASETPDGMFAYSSSNGAWAANEPADQIFIHGISVFTVPNPELYSTGLGAAGKGRDFGMTNPERRYAELERRARLRRKELRQALERALEGDTAEGFAISDDAVAILLLSE